MGGARRSWEAASGSLAWLAGAWSEVGGGKQEEVSPRQVGARPGCGARHPGTPGFTWEDKGSWWWASIGQCPHESWLWEDATVAGGVHGSGVVTQRTHSKTWVCLILGLQRRIEQEKGPRSQELLLNVFLSSMTRSEVFH